MKDDQNPEWMWSVDVSEEDGKYLFLYILRDTSRVCEDITEKYFIEIISSLEKYALDLRSRKK